MTTNKKPVNIENKIYTTSDYSMFKSLSGNRILNTPHVNDLKESMKERDLKIPIIINEKNQVVDGQHRLQARIELKLPVYYIIASGLNIHDTQKANANNKNWIGGDFLNFYVSQNYHHYKILKEFQDKFRFTNQISRILLQGNQNHDEKEYRSGGFTTNGTDHAYKYAERLYQLEPFYKGFKRRSFVLAMVHAFNNPAFNFDQFLGKIRYQSTKLVDCTGIDQYLKIIEDIYNFKRSPEDKIRLR